MRSCSCNNRNRGCKKTPRLIPVYLLNYANSGDVTQEKDRVVGYASVGLRSPYTNEEKKELLSITRNAVTEYVTNRKTIELDIDPRLRTDGAVLFVTIKEKGSLRGCIGHVPGNHAIYQSVIKNAIAASSSDPRFPPLTKNGFQDIEIRDFHSLPNAAIERHQTFRSASTVSSSEKVLRAAFSFHRWQLSKDQTDEPFSNKSSPKTGLCGIYWKIEELYIFTAEILK